MPLPTVIKIITGRIKSLEERSTQAHPEHHKSLEE